MRIRHTVVLAAGLALAGCSQQGATPSPTGGDSASEATAAPDTATASSPPSPTDTPSPEEASTQAAVDSRLDEYLAALASSNHEVTSAASDTVVPGSPAAAYLAYQDGRNRSNTEAGFDEPDDEMTEVGAPNPDERAVRLCTPGPEPACGTFADFELADTGQVVTHTIDGTELDGRITTGEHPPVEAGPAQGTLVAGYRSVSGNLVVIATLTNTSDATIEMYPTSAEYLSPGGTQLSVQNAQSATSLRAGATTTAAMVFADSELGGTVYIPLYDDAGDEHELAFELSAS